MQFARRYDKNTEQYSLQQNAQACWISEAGVKHVGGANKKQQTEAQHRFLGPLSSSCTLPTHPRPYPREMTSINTRQNLLLEYDTHCAVHYESVSMVR